MLVGFLCLLLGQRLTYAINFAGNTFSGIVTEPSTIAEGPVNIKFTSNYISVMCPIKETALKTWLLHKVTSFGQCGGIFTFEVCKQCSDSSSSVSRCSISLLQHKPTIILNILERAIRSNPNTSEIHYERSILGDIYHCGHNCAQPGRLMPAYSDPNIFSSGLSYSPPRTMLASLEVHNTTDPRESSDSGLPGTPQPEELSIVSTSIPSPTPSYRSNQFHSPRHYPRSPSEDEQKPVFRRRQSDETPSSRIRSDEVAPLSPPYSTIKTIDNPRPKPKAQDTGRVEYALIDYSATRVKPIRPLRTTQNNDQPTTTPTLPLTTVDTVETDTLPVNTTDQVPRQRRNNYNKLRTLQESTEVVDDVIYDVPNCEFLTDPFVPSSAPARSYMVDPARRSPSHQSTLSPSPQHIIQTTLSPSPQHTPQNTLSPSPQHIRESPIGSPNSQSPTHTHTPIPLAVAGGLYTPGMDLRDREEDYEDAWVSPIRRHKMKAGQSQVPHPTNKNIHLTTRGRGSRRRFQSSSDALDIPTTNGYRVDQNQKYRPKSLNGCDRHLEKTSNDFLQRLNEEEEKLSKVLAASRMEKNEEVGEGEEASDRLSDLNKPYMFNMDDLDHDYADPDTILETCSNIAEYHTERSQPSYLSNRLQPLALTKEPTNNIKGYAYKVTIPFTNTQYDVPRRAAAAPDLTTMSNNAPPKPKRHTSTEHLYFV